MTTFLLVRHASHDLLGKALAGRASGVVLNAQGRDEAAAIAECLSQIHIDAIYTSPRERARETADALAQRLKTSARIDSALDEIDFGDWTGRAFGELSADPKWDEWVHHRSVARPPNGEAFVDVQRRVVAGMGRLLREHSAQTLALFSHGDVIKAALAHYLRASLDDLERFDIAPASVSVIVAEKDWAQVRLLNGRSFLFS
jgi:broad specificity phosphatase PhoE